MKRSYQDLLKAHNLPDVQPWLTLDDELTLADVRSAFQDKLFSYADMVNQLVRPEDLNAMMEAQVFDELEREQLDTFYNQLMLRAKDCLLAEIEANEEEELSLVRQLCTEWPGVVREMQRIVRKTKQAYQQNKAGVHMVSYLG